MIWQMCLATGKMDPKMTKKAASLPHQQTSRADNNRWLKCVHLFFFRNFFLHPAEIPHVWLVRSRQGQEPDAKRLKTDVKNAQEKNTKEVVVKMIELDIPSSDEELWCLIFYILSQISEESQHITSTDFFL